MKLTTLTADIDVNGARTAASPRARRRALLRLNRAESRFARTESALESALAAVISAEAAVAVAVDRPDLDEVTVAQRRVPRNVAPEYLAMAQHDLAVAVRRHADAAARVRRCLVSRALTADVAA